MHVAVLWHAFNQSAACSRTAPRYSNEPPKNLRLRLCFRKFLLPGATREQAVLPECTGKFTWHYMKCWDAELMIQS